MSTGNDIEILVYVFGYRTELASREQFLDFGRWLQLEGIDDWVFCGRGETRDEADSLWFIAVVDATGGRTFNEFRWTGEFQEIDEDEAMEIITRARPGSSGVRYPEPIAAVLRPDGTWAIPSAERYDRPPS